MKKEEMKFEDKMKILEQTINELEKYIEMYLKKNFSIDEKFLNNINKEFEIKDTNNSYRNFLEIKKEVEKNDIC